MLIQELKEILQDQAHIFQDTYLESSQMHQVTILYHFEHVKQYILIIFYFKIFTKAFFMRVICISIIFHI